MDNASPRRRHWFRFGIGSLFVAVAVFAVAIYYDLQWIGERHRILEHNQVLWHLQTHGYFEDETINEPGTPPTILRLFGEPGYSKIDIIVQASSVWEITSADLERIEHAERIFPEAIVRARHFGGNIVFWISEF